MATKQAGKLDWSVDKGSYRALPVVLPPEVQTQIDLVTGSKLPNQTKNMIISALRATATPGGVPLGIARKVGRDASGAEVKSIIEVSGGACLGATGSWDALSITAEKLRVVAEHATAILAYLDTQK